MKTCRMMKLCGVLVAVSLVGSVSMAGDHGWSRGSYQGSRCGGHKTYGRSYHGHYNGGRHYGYYHNPRGELVFGLLGLGLIAAVASSAERTVYVESAPVVVQQPPVVYVQQPAVVQQPVVVQVEQPQRAMVTINIQNSNGSMTPVTLHAIGSQWVGPRGEYYDAMPTVGQLRPVYGF